MVTRIRKAYKRRLYVSQWREAKGLSPEQIAGRVGITRESYYRWEREHHRLTPEKLSQLADAMGIEPEQFWRLPDTESLDALIKDAPADIQAMAADIVRRMVGKAS